jgi:hypothetical protein
MNLLLLLLAGHAVADYPLQGDFLAKGKNHTAPIAGFDWWILLAMHALIHGGMVQVITGSPILGAAETVLHFTIDYGKNAGWFGFRFDQTLHVASKVVWAVLFWSVSA